MTTLLTVLLCLILPPLACGLLAVLAERLAEWRMARRLRRLGGVVVVLRYPVARVCPPLPPARRPLWLEHLEQGR